MTQTITMLTTHQRWRLRRWLVDDLVPELLPLVGIDDGMERPWAGWHTEYALGRLALLHQEHRDRGKHPDHQAELLADLAAALRSWHQADYEAALNAAQRAISAHASHPRDRENSRDWRTRWTTTMHALLAEPEPSIAPVGRAEIARMAGVQPDTVDEWRRRHQDFPEHRWMVGSQPAYEAADIERWLADSGRPYTPYHEAFPFR